MSPFMLPVMMALAAGVVLFVAGLIRRRRGWIVLGTPAAILLVLWLLAAWHPPDAEKEFARLFPNSNRAHISDLKTTKPLLMDGYFLSFRIAPENFARLHRGWGGPHLEPGALLCGQDLPTGWPSSLLTHTAVFTLEVNGDWLQIAYLPNEQRAFASVRYASW